MPEDKRLEKMINIVIFATVLIIMAAAAPIETEHDVTEEDSDRSLAEEIINYDESEPSDADILANKEKRYLEDFLEKQSREERRQRIHQLKQKNIREQRRRREERRQKKLRRNGRKKLRVNRDTPRLVYSSLKISS